MLCVLRKGTYSSQVALPSQFTPAFSSCHDLQRVNNLDEFTLPYPCPYPYPYPYPQR
jgi:hypothetical protein